MVEKTTANCVAFLSFRWFAVPIADVQMRSHVCFSSTAAPKGG
jgi:hypothetical protein